MMTKYFATLFVLILAIDTAKCFEIYDFTTRYIHYSYKFEYEAVYESPYDEPVALVLSEVIHYPTYAISFIECYTNVIAENMNGTLIANSTSFYGMREKHIIVDSREEIVIRSKSIRGCKFIDDSFKLIVRVKNITTNNYIISPYGDAQDVPTLAYGSMSSYITNRTTPAVVRVIVKPNDTIHVSIYGYDDRIWYYDMSDYHIFAGVGFIPTNDNYTTKGYTKCKDGFCGLSEILELTPGVNYVSIYMPYDSYFAVYVGDIYISCSIEYVPFALYTIMCIIIGMLW